MVDVCSEWQVSHWELCVPESVIMNILFLVSSVTY